MLKPQDAWPKHTAHALGLAVELRRPLWIVVGNEDAQDGDYSPTNLG